MAVAGGRIAALLDAGAEAPAKKTIDMAGCMSCPALIDMHVHALRRGDSFRRGYRCVVPGAGRDDGLDLGSCGALMLDGLRRYVLDVCRTRLFTPCHIIGQGDARQPPRNAADR